jgi:hypothetical protein
MDISVVFVGSGLFDVIQPEINKIKVKISNRFMFSK